MLLCFLLLQIDIKTITDSTNSNQRSIVTGILHIRLRCLATQPYSNECPTFSFRFPWQAAIRIASDAHPTVVLQLPPRDANSLKTVLSLPFTALQRLVLPFRRRSPKNYTFMPIALAPFPFYRVVRIEVFDIF